MITTDHEDRLERGDRELAHRPEKQSSNDRLWSAEYVLRSLRDIAVRDPYNKHLAELVVNMAGRHLEFKWPEASKPK